MATIKFTPDRENSTLANVWIQKELLDWIDHEAESNERSRAFMINLALHRYRHKIEADRKRRAS